MRMLSLAVGAAALIGGTAYLTAAPSFHQHVLSAQDIKYAWTLSQGPKGERDPSALPLYQAIIARDRSKVEQLLDRGLSPDAMLHQKRYSPVMLAIEVNAFDIADLLIKRGANLNYTADSYFGTALEVSMNGAIRHVIGNLYVDGDRAPPDYYFFWHLVNAGADINLGHTETINSGTPNEQVVDNDVASIAATLGQMQLVNQLLARGYRHDLPRLRETLSIRVVSDEIQPEKDKALATVDGLIGKK